MRWGAREVYGVFSAAKGSFSVVCLQLRVFQNNEPQ